jgi:hypothetical protein
MALEPAGVSLQAEGFNDYFKKLTAIEKKQREVFDAKFKETGKSFADVQRAARAYESELKRVAKAQQKAAAEAEKLAEAERKAAKAAKKSSIATKGIGLAAAGGIGLGLAAVSKLTDAIVNLASTSAKFFIEFTKGGIALNRQFELTEKVFTNVFGDPQLGKATVDFLNETADSLRIARGEASSFAQTILPKTGGLDEFTELLRLTDIQADTTGQKLSELEFSIREALSGDFVSLKDRFDLGTEQINRIKELTPELGRSQALITVLTDEFTRLGKVDISGTLGTNIKDLQATFTGLQATLGKPGFEQLRIQSEGLLNALNRNEEGLQRTAIALGEVTSNVIELVGTELVEFIDSLDFTSIEDGVNTLNAFVEGLRIASVTLKEAFKTGVAQTAFGLITQDTGQILAGFNKIREADFGQSFRNIADATTKASERQRDYKKRVDEAANSQSNFNEESRKSIDDFLSQQAAQDQATSSIQSYTSALKQAEQLQLSFSRAAEDTAIKLARANEDIARKQAKSVADLETRQVKDRDKLLKDQQKQLDKFEKDREKQIALSRLQSERRFSLSERRLRAEGDILAIQQLREDRDLERKEEKENFDLGKKEQVQSAEEQQREQAKDLESRVNELKSSLEDQRAELLKSFDEQFNAQQQAQAEARAQQQRGFEEAAAEREIQLAREEEDRRLSQARQLEDLGRSLSEQQGVTEEGVNAIAGELEKVFGQEGVADSIFTGFKDRTESDFKDLFENIGEVVSDAKVPEPPKIPVEIVPSGGGGFGARIGGVQEFQEGGVVGGPIGSPQIIQAHGGETVLPTHQRSFTMTAPVIPSQSLEVTMGGGFNISGGEQAGEAAVQAAVVEMTENFKIAVGRLARRN